MATVHELNVNINADTKGLKKGFTESKRQTQDFTKSIKNLAASIGVAFGVREIARFTGEVIKLAGEAEGVENAFFRLADSAMLEDLREATRGTVSDLELMKKTVLSANLGLPIENLARLLEFASRRAQETGESVEYLVQSLVRGIGLKSTRVLDNLGISATRLKAEIGGAGIEMAAIADVAAAVGRIAEQEFSKMGDAIITTKDKVEQLSASWTNLKVEIGKTINDSIANINGMNKAIDATTTRLEIFRRLRETGASFNTVMDELIFRGKEWIKYFNELDKVTEKQNKKQATTNKQTIEFISLLDAAKAEVVDLKTQINKVSQGDLEGFGRLNAQLKEAEGRLKRLQSFTGPEIKGIKPIEPGIVSIKTEQEGEGIGDKMIQSAQKYREELVKINAESITLSDTQMQLGANFAMIWANGIAGAENMGEAVKNAAKSTINALIAEGLTALIKNVFTTVPFPFSIPAAIAAGAAGGAIMHGVSKLAEGGITTGPQMAMVGDNPSGKEAIIPFEKMGQFMNMAGGGGAVRFVIRGKELVGVLEREEKYNKFTR